MSLTYRQLQAQVKTLREQGYPAPKLNSKATVLAAFVANPGVKTEPTPPKAKTVGTNTYRQLQAQVRTLRESGLTTPKLNSKATVLQAYLAQHQDTTPTLTIDRPMLQPIEPTETPMVSPVNPHLPVGHAGPEADDATKQAYINWAVANGPRRGKLEMRGGRHRFNTNNPDGTVTLGTWY